MTQFSHVWLHFYPPALCREKPSEYCDFLLLPAAGIEPGPPEQQASALSITPLPLGNPACIDTAHYFLLIGGSFFTDGGTIQLAGPIQAMELKADKWVYAIRVQ